ncbi:efflux RND transporter periplasmic adaptor subunit [Thalassovita taeanensis]|uniref:RND family efflux transporter, MFP subunit n=1 Tax=Thalassovita taeanensis TaxID=657014 RepID=A0A1H9AUZ9_9RHOB|nr:HlyD family efflux transporter periplasmic adaptor subunit [Thalassovita taeanensis]SEP79748.1 RND family efflux transporter, MFP subunit [Thalassovita taeanensis]
MRFLRQSLTGLFLMSLTLGMVIYAGAMVRDAIQARLAKEAHVPQARERVFAVTVVQAEPQTLSPVLTAFGQVQSRRTLEIRAAVAGTVIELSQDFEEGSRVEAGQVLARIDPANAQSALDRAKNDQLDAEAETRDAARALELARDELSATQEQAELRERAFQRQKELSTRGVVTDAAVETAELAASSARQAVVSRRQALAQAEARVDQAATTLARASIALAEAERRLADTVIRAGFSGTLDQVAVVEGGLVSLNEQLARLIDGDALEVAFRISTPQYARLLDAQGRLIPAPVQVTLDVYGVDLVTPGQISRDSAAVGEGQTGRLIFARIDQPRGLKPGDFVSVAVEEPPLERVVRLPSKALDSAGNVLVLDDDERLEALAVELLRRQGDDVLVRAPGLAGREVVAERTPLLGAGIKVRVLRPAEEAAVAAEVPDMVELSAERRARLVSFVEDNQALPADVRTRILTRLQDEKVPAQMVQRLESRMGG